MSEIWIWLPVVEYEDSYEISDHGHVRSIDRTAQRSDGRICRYQGRLLTPSKHNKHGHLAVKLSRNGKGRTVLVHQLMLRVFIGERPPGQESLHANDIPTDNRLANLSYGTRSDNALDQVRNGHHNQASKTACVNGHEFTPENTYRRPSGGRRCRACQHTHGENWNQNRRRAS